MISRRLLPAASTATNCSTRGSAAMVASLNDPYSHYYDPSALPGLPERDQSAPERDRSRRAARPARAAGRRRVPGYPGRARRASARRRDRRGRVDLAGRPFDDFGSQLIKGAPGRAVTLTILRGKQTQALTITRVDHRRPGGERQNRHLPRNQDRLRGADRVHRRLRRRGAHRRREGAPRGRAGADPRPARQPRRAARTRPSTSPASSSPTARSSRPPVAPSRVRCTSPGAARSRRASRWSCWSNRDTASAAEIVTGALKDRGRAMVVGTQHLRQGRLPGDRAALQRRRARHHGRRVLHAERPQPRGRRRIGQLE